jgi:isopenicillin-N epimerase
MDADPVRFYGHGVPERLAHARRHVAAFLGADPERSALVANVTAGTAIVLNSLGLRAGDEVVTTDHGHGGIAMALRTACGPVGATFTRVALPLRAADSEIIERVQAAVTARTRLVVIDQVSSPTARVFPVAAVVSAARQCGAAVLVDAAHAPGLLPTPVAEIGADFWVGNLHKWAYAPRGTALLSVAPTWVPRIRPVVNSWEAGAGFPGNVEYQGTIDYSPWLSAPAGIYTLRTLGVDRVREHNAGLAVYGQRVVAAALDVAPGDLPDPGGPGRGADPVAATLPMRVVPLPDGIVTDPAAATALRRRIADELNAQVAVNAWQGRGLLRLSAQVYNRAEEYERLAERLPEFLRRVAAGG